MNLLQHCIKTYGAKDVLRSTPELSLRDGFASKKTHMTCTIKLYNIQYYSIIIINNDRTGYFLYILNRRMSRVSLYKTTVDGELKISHCYTAEFYDKLQYCH